MNGRLYDAKLHRFLQPDNYVQDPSNTQNYNRYGYCWNNSLKFTDPSGEFIWAPIIVGAIIGAIAGGAGYVAQAIQTGDWNLGKFGMSVWGGAILGGITGGVAPMSVVGVSVAQVAATSFVIGMMPAYGVQVGDWSFSISPAIAFGNTAGIGASLSVTYSSGDFSFSGGIGIMSNSNYNSLGKSGMEIRKSILASYDDGKTGLSLGTNFWSGTKGMEELKQRSSLMSFKSGDFSFSYETHSSFVHSKMATGAITDDSLNFASNPFAVGEIYAGAKLTIMGLNYCF